MVKIVKSAPKSDSAVMLLTFALTVVFDLVVAIVVGIILATILFMKRMSDETSVRGWKTVDEVNDPDSIRLKTIPAHTRNNIRQSLYMGKHRIRLTQTQLPLLYRKELRAIHTVRAVEGGDGGGVIAGVKADRIHIRFPQRREPLR